jgi:octaprenyl-diphosphate synthase
MELLSTEQGIEALRRAAAGRVESHAGLFAARALFETDVRFVDAAMAADANVGEVPGSRAATHLVAAGGKRIRALSVLLSAACFGEVPRAARELAVVAEMVHAATLLHDDVIDDGDERRGHPTSRKIFGNAVSVLAGDLLLTHALDRTARAAPDAMSDLLVTLRALVDGEIIQLRGRTELDLRASTYHSIVRGKTASLFGWAARAGARAAGAEISATQRLGRFGEHLGVAFQLVDDVLDYEGDPRETGKLLLADLYEGKVTLPLALAAAKQPTLAGDIGKVRAGDEEAASRVARAVRESGVCDEVRDAAVRATGEAVASLVDVPASPARELLERVAVELTARRA